MKKILVFVLNKIISLIFDMIQTFMSLTHCERLAIIKLVSIGLTISGIYGFYSEQKFGDLVLVMGALYGTIKSKRKIKEIEC